MKDSLEETKRNSAYFRKQGFNLVECWECEWRGMKRSSKNLQRFIATRLRRPMDKVKTMTLETILEAARCEKLFGCVECDIHVPEHSREKFCKMCPVFKNTEISRDDIGEFMKAYAEENDIMSRSCFNKKFPFLALVGETNPYLRYVFIVCLVIFDRRFIAEFVSL